MTIDFSLHAEDDMDDIWRYDPADNAWTFINVKGKKPEPRYLHTAVVVQDAMLVFGGTKKTAGEVWSFSFRKLAWSKLSNVSCLLVSKVARSSSALEMRLVFSKCLQLLQGCDCLSLRSEQCLSTYVLSSCACTTAMRPCPDVEL